MKYFNCLHHTLHILSDTIAVHAAWVQLNLRTCLFLTKLAEFHAVVKAYTASLTTDHDVLEYMVSMNP